MVFLACQDLAEAAEAIASRDAACGEKERNIAEQDAKIKEAAGANQVLQQQVLQLGQQLEDLQDNLRHTEVQLQSQCLQSSDTASERDALQAMLEGSEQQLVMMQEKLHAAESRLASEKQAVSAADEIARSTQMQLEAVTSQLKEAEEREVNIKSSIADLEDTMAQLRANLQQETSDREKVCCCSICMMCLWHMIESSGVCACELARLLQLGQLSRAAETPGA